MKEFKSKTAIIIGGTSDIGYVTAKALLDKDTIVHIVGRNINKIGKENNVYKHQVDISKKEDFLKHHNAIPVPEGFKFNSGTNAEWETIESLRLLTNLETEKQKLLQVVLFGQPELDKLLNRADLRQLKQRIEFAEYLSW